MSKRFVTMLAGVAALAMLVGGCGGGSGDDESLTKAEFIKQADAMCQEANKQFGKEFQALAKENKKSGKRAQSITAEGIEVGEKIYVPNAQVRAEGLEDLSPPSGEEEKIETIVAAIEEGVEKGEENPKSLMSASEFPFLHSNKLQQEYGFKYCGAGQAG